MIDRRTFLRSTAGIVTLGGMAVATAAATAPALSVDLAERIKAHQEAFAAMSASNDGLASVDRAYYADRTNESARQAKEAAYAVQSEFVAAERAAFCSLLSYPFESLADLRLIMAIARDIWWTDCTPEDDEVEALLAGIMGGAA